MIGTSKVLAIIPARAGSKGVPGKNILHVGGKPLLQWTIDAALKSRYIDRLILSSDDTAIMEIAAAAGCDVPFLRDASLAGDDVSSIDVVVDALERIPGFDIAVLLQPTSPLRTTADIDGSLERLHLTGAPACVTVRAADDHPYWTFYTDEDGCLVHYSDPPAALPTRRQDLPIAWCLNGAVYVARVDSFLDRRSFFTPQTVCYPMPIERSLDIDTPEDIAHLLSAVQSTALSFGKSPISAPTL
jgi:CMP-N,N'-diacetyllegionaminic acid synthase